MRSQTLWKILPMVPFFLFACGDDDDGDDDKPIEEIKEETLALISGWDLMGKWQSDCHGTELFDRSVRTFYEFSGDDITKEYRVYATEDCQQDPIATISMLGEFKLDEDPQKREGYRAMDQTFNKIRVNIDSEVGQAFFEALDFCGIENWSMGEPIDVTEASQRENCPLPDVPTTNYDLIKIDGGKLYFGVQDLKFFLEKQQRPEEISPDREYTKVDD